VQRPDCDAFVTKPSLAESSGKKSRRFFDIMTAEDTPVPASGGSPQPQTRSDLQRGVREQLQLPASLESALLGAIDAVLIRQERLWRNSKQEAIQALSAGFSDKMARINHELSAKDATVSSISGYFEKLVSDLTDKSQRDPKTKLMNFGRFTEQLESFIALEQRGTWCAVGLVDISGFKWYNDALGHAVGDQIIDRVAQLLREQVRSDDLIARERSETSTKDLHARFGGDEFCFLIPDVDNYPQAYAVAERFRDAVARYDWTAEDHRLVVQPVRVDVGVVCLWLGHVAGRHFIARSLCAGLIQRADRLMYEAKQEHASHIHLARFEIENGDLVEFHDDRTRASEHPHS
jgi:GGDEF domain-containing protein